MANHTCARCGLGGTSLNMVQSRPNKVWYCREFAPCDKRRAYQHVLGVVAEEVEIARVMKALDNI